MNNKLNILFLYSNAIIPIKGGIQNVTYELSELMENDCMRLNMSNNAYKKSEQFQLNKIGEKWLTLFSSLVKN